MILDTNIHNGLSEEWQDKLQEASDYQAQDDLPEILTIFLHKSKEKAERPLLFDSIKFYRRTLFDKIGTKNITEALTFATIYKLL